jgi:hypothetical protein
VAVYVCRRLQKQLKPVTAGPVVPDGRIMTDLIAHLRPSRPGDPKVNHAGSLQMSDLPAAAEQGWLIAEAGPAFPGRPGSEHDGDEGIPPVVILAGVHARDGKQRERNTAPSGTHLAAARRCAALPATPSRPSRACP